MSDINATGSLKGGVVSATLTLGDAVLVLTFPRDDDQAADDMVTLVERSGDAFAAVFEAIVAEAERVTDDERVNRG